MPKLPRKRPLQKQELLALVLQGLQAQKHLLDAKDKRSINADAKLLPVFGKPQVTMFELAGIVGKHLTA